MTLIKRILLPLALLGIAAGVGYWYFFYRSTNGLESLYTTQLPQQRTIKQIIDATGSLEAQGTINIGSLVSGIVLKLYAEDNQNVKQGELLAEIDIGKSDTDVQATLYALKEAEAASIYARAVFERQKQLFEKNNISRDAYERAERDMLVTQNAVERAKALHEKATIEWNNTRIVAPVSGTIIKKNVSVGEAITTFAPPTILYTIATDLTIMDVNLEIDEGSIGALRIGQTAEMTFDTYPHKVFLGKIQDIYHSPIKKQGSVAYEAIITLKNKELLLRPGMTVNATILVDERSNVLCVPGYIFAIKRDLVRYLANKLNYSFKELSSEELNTFKKQGSHQENPVKTIWILMPNTIKEIPIELGINDDAYFEVVRGLQGNEHIITDIKEPDSMDEFYAQLFSRGL